MSELVYIMGEQDGEPERNYKKALIALFRASGKRIRAYLGIVRYDDSSELHVALLIKQEVEEDTLIFDQCAAIFSEMFSTTQHLDMISLSDNLEHNVRKMCCPFYTSPDYNVTTPDFYLYSNEGYNLDDVIRNGYMRTRLHADRPDGYMLCDIDPPLNDEFGPRKQLIIGNKLEGMSLFPVSQWPMPIYVLRPTAGSIEDEDVVDNSNSELIAWAAIYDRKEDVQMLPED